MGLIIVLIYLAIVAYAVYKLIKKVQEQNGKSYLPAIRQSVMKTLGSSEKPEDYELSEDAEYEAYSAPAPVSRGGRFRENKVLFGMEDRKNDWLAKQIKEEKRIYNSMDLGAVHDRSCEADEIKQRHAVAHSRRRRPL